MDIKPIRFEISQSLNGPHLVYIARDQNGVVRLRAGSRSEIEKLVSEYRPPEPPTGPIDKEAEITKQIDKLAETLAEVKEEQELKKPAKKQTEPEKISVEQAEAKIEEKELKAEEKKEFLKNEIREAISELKGADEKKSFWDRLR